MYQFCALEGGGMMHVVLYENQKGRQDMKPHAARGKASTNHQLDKRDRRLRPW